jgi:hypothetical protein
MLTVSASSTATLTSPLFTFDAYQADEAAAPADQRQYPISSGVAHATMRWHGILPANICAELPCGQSTAADCQPAECHANTS